MLHPLIMDFGLFTTALIGGLIDTLAGGGGLICLPALLMTGLSPHLALGTNKMQATFGSGSASSRLILKKQLHVSDIRLGFIVTFIGSILGTLCVLKIHADFLKQLLPPLLFIILCYMLFSRRIHQFKLNIPINSPFLMIPLGLLLGFYDGFLGPGTGSFWVVIMMILTCLNLQQATMRAKIFNFASNLASLLFFALHHAIIYQLALIMAGGQIIGGQIGAHLIIHKGNPLIRPVFLVMVSAMLIMLSYQTYFRG